MDKQDRRAKRLLINLTCARFIFCPLSCYSGFRKSSNGSTKDGKASRYYIRSFTMSIKRKAKKGYQ